MSLTKLKLEKLIEEKLKEMSLLEQEYKKLPEGQLHRHTKGNKTYYSVKNGKDNTYISKDKELVTLYKLKNEIKTYLSMSHDDISELKICAKKLTSTTNLSPLESMWLSEEYDSNPNNREYLIYVTDRGDKVRSKSEKIIADTLYKYQIPYKYELPLLVNGTLIYPDFTILKKNGDIVIWEHFGLMSNEAYRYNVIKKMIAYSFAGFYTNRNLICTYEENITSPAELLDIITRFIL